MKTIFILSDLNCPSSGLIIYNQVLRIYVCFFLFQVLDRLILYLRLVHSVDYYNTCEYPSEDEMPNRCGMIHVRGPIPPNRITQGEGQCVSLPQFI